MLVVLTEKAVVEKIAQGAIALADVLFEIEFGYALDGRVLFAAMLTLPVGGISAQFTLPANKTLVLGKVHKLSATTGSPLLTSLALRLMRKASDFVTAESRGFAPGGLVDLKLFRVFENRHAHTNERFACDDGFIAHRSIDSQK